MVGRAANDYIHAVSRWLPTLWQTWLIGQPAAQVGVAGRCYVFPFYLERPQTFSRFDTLLAVLGGAGTKLRLGLYADNGGTPQGGKLLIDSGDIAADAGLLKDFAFPSPIAVSKGFVWGVLETADAVIQFNRCNGNGWITNQGAEQLVSCRFDQAYGALPDPCPAVTTDSVTKVIGFLRVDSIT